MVDLVFKNVEAMPSYSFDVGAFFVSLAAYIVFYELSVVFFTYRIGKENIRKFVAE